MMVASSLTQFQDAFARALLAPAKENASALLTAQPGFAVYRNTVLKGCIDALQANFPAVARLVGEEWFRAAAALYARQNLPRLPMLLEYGEDFSVFLAAFEPAAELPYLAAVARLDRFWTEAHAARDEPSLCAEALATLDPVQLGATVLRPHATARWEWFDLPAYTIWSRNRIDVPGGVDQSDVEWRGEGALLLRLADAVTWTGLSKAGCAFMRACDSGEPLARAAEATLAVDPAANVSGLMAQLIGAGAFAHADY